jgi:hypothetical protein
MSDLSLFSPEKSAVISPCGRYRYTLARTWDPEKTGALFLMLNPSTADAEQDDPTIRRCTGFAKSWGCGAVTVVNLFAFRTAYPVQLMVAASVDYDIIGQENDDHIRTALDAHSRPGGIIITAWGAQADKVLFSERRTDVLKMLSTYEVQCLGTTRCGHPRHPLYVPAKALPVKIGRG